MHSLTNEPRNRVRRWWSTATKPSQSRTAKLGWRTPDPGRVWRGAAAVYYSPSARSTSASRRHSRRSSSWWKSKWR